MTFLPILDLVIADICKKVQLDLGNEPYHHAIGISVKYRISAGAKYRISVGI